MNSSCTSTEQRVLNGSNWKASQIVDIAGQLHTGKNCLAIAATNTSAGPAGLVGKLLVEFGEGEPIVVTIDTSWKTALKESPHWTSAKFDDSEWQPAVHVAKMGEAPWGDTPVADEKTKYYACPLFRKEFKVKGEIRRATLYGSALGIYRFHINGRPVGNDYFTPDWTDYHKRVYYNTYDVTDLVQANGPNAIGGVLGGGWYSGQICWAGQNIYGNRPRLLAQLEIELADGTMQTIATDGSWKTAFGPYIEGEFLAGETYDARKEIPGWASPGLDAEWPSAAVTESIPAKLQAFPGVTVQETGLCRPVKITEPKPGRFHLRHGPELRRLRAAEGRRAGRHEGRAPFRRNAQPRRHDLHDQPPRRPCHRHLHSQGRGRRGLAAAISPSTGSATSK